MATVSCDKISDPGTFQPSWTFSPGEAGDVGEAVRVPQFSDKSFGIWGTWGGGTMVIQGSWDKASPPAEASWQKLYESDNTTDIEVTADASGVVLENPIWIRPKCLVAVTSISVVLNCVLAAGAK